MNCDLIRCRHNNEEHPNCFARTEEGKCNALNSCFFKDGKCHFYKSKEEHKKAEMNRRI